MNLTLKNLSAEAQALFQKAIDEAKVLGHDFEALFEHEAPAPEPAPTPDPGLPHPNDGGGPGPGKP